MTDDLDVFELVSGRNPTIILGHDLTLEEANEKRDAYMSHPGVEDTPRIRLQRT